jgi:hypothetical protein
MTGVDKWIAAVGALASIGAAGFWLRASLLPVPDNMDTFIAALQRISRINAIAATCAALASVCAVYGFVQLLC